MPREHEQKQEPARLNPETASSPSPVPGAERASPPYRDATSLSQKHWLRAPIYAAAIGFLLCLLPSGPILALPIAGWLAVRFHARIAQAQLRPREGFRLGALAGLFAFAMVFVVGAGALAMLSAKGELRQTLLDIANRAHTLNPNLPPEQFVDYLLTPSGMTLAILSFCVLFVVLSGLGGLISAAAQQRKPPA